MASYIGIDLGTTFSAIATLDKTGRPTIVDNQDKVQSPSKNITSSCVKLEKKKFTVGHEARKAFQTGDRKTSVGRFKREMGTNKKFELENSEFSATDLSAVVLKALKKIAEKELGDIASVVITVPANFSHDARTATMEAAKIAGLNVEVIIDEPTAAALYYAFKSGDNVSGNYAVYDLGGGTFDVSIIKIENGKNVEVLATNGLHKLGGDDFDNALIKIVERKFNEKFDIKFDSNKHYNLDQAEEDKIVLSHVTKTQKAIEGEIFEITRDEFEEEISSLIAQTSMLCESVLDEADLSPENLSGVFLAGGSTRIPAVLESVEKVFKIKPTQTENVDEIVALGASLYAAYMSDGEHLTAAQEASIKKLDVQDVTSDNFGTIVVQENVSKGQDESVNKILIEKNTKRPCDFSDTFYTMFEGQERINCTVTQSKTKETDPTFVKVIWEGELELPPNRPAGQEIIVTFSYDVNSVMHCQFEDKQTGTVTEVNLDIASEEKESGIDKFLVD